MKNFDWFTNVIVPGCLTAIFAVLAVLRNKIWFLFIQLSDKRIANKIPEFQEFIRKVIVKEANSKNIFSNESREFSEKNVIKFARFKIKVENSDLILFDKIPEWNAREDIKIRQLFYFLNISKNKRAKYTSA
ncbi:hypothetical protein [Leuconostoc mesenteroides]|uniref:hypothetical protein n=1 Tax=Leuconostoc mesenteroides TaxID=1245 RepID=UPI0032DEB49C